MRRWLGGRWSRREGPRLCFALAASPTDGFFGQIAILRRSLDQLGGIYRRATVAVTFGAAVVEEPPPRWRSHLRGVSIHHVAPEVFAARGHRAQADARWMNVPPDCDFVIFTDADCLVLRPFDDLLDRLRRSPAVAGTVAHVPFPQFDGDDPAATWDALGREFLGRPLPLVHTHSLTTDSTPASRRACPFYVNFGFVVLPRELMVRLRPTYLSLTPKVAGRLRNPNFAGQVSLTLAVYSHDVPSLPLDLRYNFPNDELAEALYPESLADLRVVHYLRRRNFDRQRIFASAEDFRRFLALELRGSERALQGHVRRLTRGRYPF